MTLKKIDPEDSYIVRWMFGCGHGHVLPPGFSYWESGEACTFDHEGPPTDNASYHLYGRLVLVPIVDGNGDDMWEKLCANPDKWSQLPLAPDGLKEGMRVGDKIKLHEGAALHIEVSGEIVHYKPQGDINGLAR